jgi:hypothetical protein
MLPSLFGIFISDQMSFAPTVIIGSEAIFESIRNYVNKMHNLLMQYFHLPFTDGVGRI